MLSGHILAYLSTLYDFVSRGFLRFSQAKDPQTDGETFDYKQYVVECLHFSFFLNSLQYVRFVWKNFKNK